MISREDAIEIATKYVSDMEMVVCIPLRLVKNHIITRDFGWVFFYEGVPDPSVRDTNYLLAGNAPFIIDKKDGSLHVTGTAEPVEVYMDNYERTRFPHSA